MTDRLRLQLPSLLNAGWLIVHLFLVGAIAWWAFILAWPEPTFSTSKAYAEFARIRPDEGYWATGFGIAAAIGVWGLVTRSRAIRIGSTLLLGVNHGMVAWLVGKGSPSGTGTGLYFLVMLLAYALTIREGQRVT